MPIVNCVVCKTEFKIDQNVLDKGKGKYCSRPCFMTGRKKPKSLLCEVCGKSFLTYPYLTKKGCGKYCSKSCHHKARTTKKIRHCLYCGRDFFAEPRELEIGKGKYCSKKCGAQGNVKSPRERFIEKVIVLPGPNACWIWTGARAISSELEYGTFIVNGKTFRAHRFSYEYFRGPLGNLFACHKCDRPICVAPHHLFASDQEGNMKDAAQKGRTKASLSKQQVLEIFSSPFDSNIYLSRKYKVSPTVIFSLRRGETYKHIPRPQYP